MSSFPYRKGVLHAEAVPLPAIADAVGTPTYVYSTAALTQHFRAVTDAFADARPLVCYSVKANSNLAILRLFAGLGGGFDIVSGGELARVRHAGGEAAKTVFAGVGKTPEEMEAALAAGILLFNVESAEELEALDAVGRRLGRRAPFALRVNPEVDPRTHRYIATGLKTSKFGVPFEEAVDLYARSKKMKGVRAAGLDCHIGSQLTQSSPLRAALTKVAGLYQALKAQKHALEYLDVGGGLGITYSDETPPSAAEYARVVLDATKDTGARLVLEPGRSLVGNAGVLLTRVLYRKQTPAKRFAVVDAGMNDLLRPALYEAHHAFVPLLKRRGKAVEVDVVGPVCESTDVLARARPLVLPQPGELYAFLSAGAYGMSMASNYNSRPRPAEVLVDAEAWRVVRERERTEDLWRGERA
ncbi:diaminopimelate decarboxylase [Myxococcus sp. CA051A]|uniref:Diaminopimelate decarboxylase n=1 Tax=Myxococcus llanfairpwllgwyngyllgogerychwyrndrobwllllantysiliogogogochensis TaxID=2590453 RepID=A0A540WYC8_9BACT|nr:diaminopimelate decarboxylase [Myxococcus llanfairpwllgwyngyllgogerychwyrndrobwllllantysiliogogogochensis]NTX15885.1 diaminopimelate decarboxylase [Myxococcus sp. CA056]NTX33926.1 diaminopimelate decarboxylase [Myxococcus sp. CA033]NTX58226.1 diaminopimelate decarboxylase [Myxococcus sp. CA039A]NTX65247.1 diaminopimelate decarboxylase [Myxococcus sp. CA051A]TQF14017.1 diaminopimelate decarboxylase [Myxococcus llanfairpwllgwyngyllgogerychwyrndrobwllllantysiliogogogochensis]